MAELRSFASWKDVLAYARTGGPLYYQAPLDDRPTRLDSCIDFLEDRPVVRCPPYTYRVRAQTIRIFPPGSNLQKNDPYRADPFTADVHHLTRFRRPWKWLRDPPLESRENPLSTGQTLGWVAVGVTVVGLIGYAIYKNSQASTAATQAQTQGALANLPPMPVNVVTPSENPYTTDSGS